MAKYEGKFDRYDTIRLEKARELLDSVYEYNWGDTHNRDGVNRLGTIINKLDYLIATKGEAK